MRQREVITTTLGELIVAVTDELESLAGDPSAMYVVASCIVNELLARNQLRVHKPMSGKYSSYLAKALR